jgi:hypothetical protein
MDIPAILVNSFSFLDYIFTIHSNLNLEHTNLIFKFIIRGEKL